jgi:hypothetical protein
VLILFGFKSFRIRRSVSADAKGFTGAFCEARVWREFLRWRSAPCVRFAVAFPSSKREALRTYEIDPERFERSETLTGRAFIGDLVVDSGWHPNLLIDYSMKFIECQLVTE